MRACYHKSTYDSSPDLDIDRFKDYIEGADNVENLHSGVIDFQVSLREMGRFAARFHAFWREQESHLIAMGPGGWSRNQDELRATIDVWARILTSIEPALRLLEL
jgi:hypothetical protein